MTVKELKKGKHNFHIEWNTGDCEWDNIPNEEEFKGTFKELKNYLSDIPKDFTEELANGSIVYDTSGEIWNCELIA